MANPPPIRTSVLIVGSGSAGLCAALWLARLNVPYIVLEKRDGPLKIGQADGVQCRTVEMFESFDLDDALVKHAYWVSENCFWSQDPSQTASRIVRTGRTADVPPGLSHKPHVIMNQAYLNELLLGDIARYGGRDVDYNTSLTHVSLDPSDSDYPVRAIASRDGSDVEYRAKYLLGCDGAHSAVRRSLGLQMLGDSSDAVWGVMDIFPDTTFPDIRKKCLIRSGAGNLLIIPRERDQMVRFYLELRAGTPVKEVRLEDLQNKAVEILAPYHLHIRHTFWWSAYSIGQRLASAFSVGNRVFLTGDACHTHSPKAGQGMNLSLGDGYNIGWKLAHVLLGRCAPDLLETYLTERERTAKELVDFDRELTGLYAQAKRDGEDAATREKLTAFVTRSLRYTSGLTTAYVDSLITCATGSSGELARGVEVGMRMPSAQLVRLSDAKAVPLGRLLSANGKWRILVFAGDPLKAASRERLDQLSTAISELQYSASLLETFLLLSGSRTAIDDAYVQGSLSISDIFRPRLEPYMLRFNHNILIDDESYNWGHGHAYEKFGVDPEIGALVVVRPDQYVAMVTGLEGVGAVAGFLEGCLRRDEEDKVEGGEVC